MPGGPARVGSGAGTDLDSEHDGGDDETRGSPSADGTNSGPLPLAPAMALPTVPSFTGLPSPSRPTPQQLAALESALQVAQEGLKGHVAGIWCEALGPMVALEWPAAREQLQRPVLRASSDALLSGPHACGPAAAAHGGSGGGARGAGGGGGKGEALSQSARWALASYLAVQRVVGLTQLRELLCTGSVPKSPPIATLTDAELRQADVQEGYSVDLHPAASIPAVVSFTPGVERRVFFSIAGVAVRRLDAPDPAAAAEHALLRSLPVTVVADPSPTKPGAGVVLSVAPLLGANPSMDKNVGKWLHVHVRPSVRGLLRVLKVASSKKGGLVTSLRQLADGHWVLAFADADRSSAAKMLVHQHAITLRAAYSRHLAPLTGEPVPRPSSSGGFGALLRAQSAEAPGSAAAAAGAQSPDPAQRRASVPGESAATAAVAATAAAGPAGSAGMKATAAAAAAATGSAAVVNPGVGDVGTWGSGSGSCT